MKIRPVRVELFHADKRTGRHDEAKCNFWKFLQERLKTTVFVVVIIIIIIILSISTNFSTDVQVRNNETSIITLSESFYQSFTSI